MLSTYLVTLTLLRCEPSSTNTNYGAGNLPLNPHYYGVGVGLVLVDGVGLPSLLIY